MRINVAGRSYRDGLEIDAAQFSELLKVHSRPEDVSTSHPAPADFVEVFNHFPEQDVVAILPSSALSGSYGAALQAQASMGRAGQRIQVLDSGSISIGLGLLVLAATESLLSNPDLTGQELSSRLSALRPKLHIIFTVSSLKYLAKSGRVNRVGSPISTVLKAYHTFCFDGQKAIAPVARDFELTDALERITNKIKTDHELYTITNLHLACSYNFRQNSVTGTSGHIQAEPSTFIEQFSQRFATFDLPILHTELGCVVGVHCGPSTVGAAYITA